MSLRRYLNHKQTGRTILGIFRTLSKVEGGLPGGGGTSMFSVPGMCRWTGYSFHHSCSRAGYRFLQKCSQKGILFSNFCSQTGLQCIFLILCSQTGCGFLQFCSQTGVFKMRKMLPDRVKITAPQRHTPVHIRTKCPPGGGGGYRPLIPTKYTNDLNKVKIVQTSERFQKSLF